MMLHVIPMRWEYGIDGGLVRRSSRGMGDNTSWCTLFQKGPHGGRVATWWWLAPFMAANGGEWGVRADQHVVR
jgi:hypothetical protein